MALGRQVDVLDVGGGAEQAINVLKVGKLDSRGVLGPIFAAGDKELRPGRGQGGDVGVIGDVVEAPVDRHPAFAIAAPEEVGRNHDDRNGYGHSVVHGGDYETLGPASRSPGDPDPFHVDVVQGIQEVEAADTVPELERQDERMIMGRLRRVPPPDHVIRKNHGSHPGEHGAAHLHVRTEPASTSRIGEMAMGAEDGGEGGLSSLRPVKVPGHEESGKTREGDIFDAVAGIFAPAVNDGIERAFLGRRPQSGTLQDAGSHLPGAGLPLFECRAAAEEFGQLMLSGRLAEVISLAEFGPIRRFLLIGRRRD
jgi:hypothetical protein